MKNKILTLICCTAATAAAAQVEQLVRDLKMNEPFAVSFGSNGVWYICEHKGERITAVDKSGRTTTIAGTGAVGYTGDGGKAIEATMRDPHGIVIDRKGIMYVADTLNHTIRRIELKTGTISTVAGTGEKGFAGDGGPAVKALFNGTFGLALNSSGDRIYVADLNNRRIRMMNVKDGMISTIAGNGQEGVPSDGSNATESPLVDPRAVTVDSKGAVYILERRGNALRVVDASGKIRTLIGPGTIQPDLKGPKHLCVDKRDRVIIADAENHLIRMYDPRTGKTTTIAGTGRQGDHIEPADPLRTDLNRPHGVSVDNSGALFVTDSYNHRILRVTGY